MVNLQQLRPYEKSSIVPKVPPWDAEAEIGYVVSSGHKDAVRIGSDMDIVTALVPSKFKKGDRYAVRAYAKNNLSLYLSLDAIVYNVDNWGTPIKEMLEKVIPAG